MEIKAAEILRIGMIGCDTSHVPAFTKLLNDKDAEGILTEVEVVAVYPDFSPDVALSRDRVEMFTEQIRELNVEITDSVTIRKRSAYFSRQKLIFTRRGRS